MDKVLSTTVVVAAVDKGKDDDFYPVLAWLRDTCIPDIRPLYNVMNDHYDDELKAAALVKHQMEDGSHVYELVLHHGHLEKRVRSGIMRQAPTLATFIKHLTQV
jgi:hypothetical protein